ncbi:hypothetical protein KY289_013384 [Solanum tuberosum]|nr:hypothetical protein KY289_013384 [Solanum tuberosum]
MQALQRPGGASNGDGHVPYFTPNQYNQILQMLNKSNTNDSSANMADSGATNHMVSSKTLLNRDSTVNPGKVQIATGDSATITHSGSSQLIEGEVIEDDLFTGKVKEIGKEEDGLYLLRPRNPFQTQQGASSLVAAKGCENDVTWHKRLGHVPMNMFPQC